MNRKIIGLIITSILLTTISVGNVASDIGLKDANDFDNKNYNDLLNLQPIEIEIIEINGGFSKIKVEFKNIGDDDLKDIDWSIEIIGGLLDSINVVSGGTIQEIQAGSSKIISSGNVFGFGPISIKINIDDVEKTVNGFVYLFYVKVNPELVVDFKIIASGLNSPIYLANAGDGSNRLFVADQIGKIYIIENDELIDEPFLDITDRLVELDSTYDERGLLGLAFHPDFSENGKFYIYYSSPKEGAGVNHESILSEFIVSNEYPNIADKSTERIIFRTDEPESNHNGGQIVFGPDGYLYLGLGDGGGAGDQHQNIGNGQDINTFLGSIIRIDINQGDPYSIPSDNPFVEIDGLDEIYAWGFRNPWRFSFDSENGNLFVADVGQDNWEEIDIVEKGINYGWRIMEGTHFYDEQLADDLGIDVATLGKPIHEYSHSVGRSITGGYVYRGTNNPEIEGKYVFGDWSTSFFRANGKLYYLEEIEPGVWERYELRTKSPFNRFILSFGQDENGELYILSKTNLGPTGTTGDVRRIIVT